MQRYLTEIAQDRSRGAGELARRCLEMLEEAAADSRAEGRALLAELRGLAQALQRCRPAMAPIQNLVQRWLDQLSVPDADASGTVRQTAIERARALRELSTRAAAEAARHAAALARGKTVITHSLSSTVCETFRALGKQLPGAIITESRPLNEGHRLARFLSELSIPTILITDAQLGLFARRADLALVGADSVLADRSLVNKSGTLLLALAAREAGIPFYACCESFKFCKRSAGELELEENAAAELGAPELPRLTVRNVYFDITPPHLISGWITEEGLHR